MKRLFFGFILLLFQLTLFSQQINDTLYWDSKVKLSWKDFMGSPSANDNYDAETTAENSTIGSFVNGLPFYKINCYFLRNKSWAKVTSNILLSHEQGHFDLAEYIARKTRKKVKELRKKKISDFEIYVNEITLIFQERVSIDEKYDLETIHGTNEQEQKRWDQMIKKKLIELQELEI